MEEDCGLFVVVTAVNRSRHLSNQYFVYCVNTLFLVFAQCNKPSSVVPVKIQEELRHDGLKMD